MPSIVTSENCIDIVKPFRDGLAAEDLLDSVQFIGGIGTAALAQEATIILPEEKRIVAPADLYLSRLRPDGNVRDVDSLVLSSDESLIAQVDTIAEETVGAQLENSTFGFRDAMHLQAQRENPFGFSAWKTFVGDRYAWPSGEVDKGLFPFSVPMHPDSLESWHLEIGDEEYPVANPATSILNYLTRSISGLRPKDAVKIQGVAANIFGKAPELIDWTLDGPGQSQLELGKVLHTLREPANHAGILVVGGAIELHPLPIRSLMDHPAFMLHEYDTRTQEHILAISKVKAMALHEAESQEAIVTLFQRYAERMLGTIIKNS
ncbi:MAG TPA: hypothetical protein VHB72_00700 [Candidatus Saccharimonadales bacterium]|nr:hypothetical protein [Candidatus Saccharimonadales bacterium]